MSIGLAIDSNSQIPAELIDKYDVEVVPISVSVDGVDYQEGVDLDADGFYALFGEDAPEVTTSQPSPGAFIEAYERLMARGATEILSVHVGASFSGTINSARIASESISAPVQLVDTETMSFGITCCLWEAAEAIRAGADLQAAADVAGGVAARVRSTFIVQALDFARAGGRWEGRVAPEGDGIPVMTMGPGDAFAVSGTAHTVDDLCDLMVAEVAAGGAPMRAAVCIADAAAAPFWEGIESRLRGRSDVVDLVRYRVGPSVGAHTGPGTAGAFWYPVRPDGT